jgi:hypothetical protein
MPNRPKNQVSKSKDRGSIHNIQRGYDLNHPWVNESQL